MKHCKKCMCSERCYLVLYNFVRKIRLKKSTHNFILRMIQQFQMLPQFTFLESGTNFVFKDKGLVISVTTDTPCATLAPVLRGFS